MRSPYAWVAVALAVALAGAGAFVLLRGDGGAADPGFADGDAVAVEGVAGAAPALAGRPAPGVVEGAPSDLRIEGRVVESPTAGVEAPVAGVRVVARRTGPVFDSSDPTSWGGTSPAHAFRESLDRIDAPKTDLPASDAEAESAADGTFVLRPKAPGNYEVVARAEPPRAWARGWVAVLPARPKASVLLRLGRGTRLAGRVVDDEDRALAAVVDGSWQTESLGYFAAHPVATDPATGEFSFPAVPDGRGTLSVRLAGRVSLSGFGVRTPHEGVYVIRVSPGGAVRGRVTDAEGRAVSGADLTVTTTAQGRAAPGSARTSLGRAKSGTDGLYRVDGLLPGAVQGVTALAEGFGLYAEAPPRAPWSGASVARGGEAVVDVRLLRGGSIVGRVTETGTGRALPDTRVSAYRAGHDAMRQWVAPLETRADADGRYRVDGVAPGRWVVVPTSPSHYLKSAETGAPNQPMSFLGGGAPPDLTVVLAKEGEEVERHIELAPGFPVRGRVVDPEGKAVAGASVRAHGQGLGRAAWQWGISVRTSDEVATSREDGAFEIPGLAPRDEWILSAKKAPFVAEPSPPVRVGAGTPTPDVVLRLAVGASVAGRVVDAEGKAPASGGNVSYWRQDGRYGYADYGNATLEAEGTFLLESVPPATVQLQVWAGGQNASTTVEDLKPGERRTGVEVRLERTVALSGVLVDADGSPVPARTLMAQGGSGRGGSSENAVTDDEGRFSFAAVPEGAVQISVYDPVSFDTLPVGSATAPAADVRLVWARPRKTVVSGTVRGPGGEPVPLCTVAVSGARDVPSWGGDPNEVVNGEFRREVEGVPPFELVASAPRDARGRAMNLRRGKATVADPSRPAAIVLEPGLEVSGHVLGSGDAGVEGARVSVDRVTVTTDAAGAFTIGGLEPGEVSLAVAPTPRFVAPAPVKARAGDRGVVIRLTAGGVVAGRVVGPDGRPRQSASVQATWTAPTQGSTFAQPDAEGRFRLTGLPEGSVDLRVHPFGQPGGESLRPAELKGVRTGTEDVTVALSPGVSVSGTVVTTDGSPTAGFHVTAHRVDPQEPSQAVQVGADGRFEVLGLAPGATAVRVQRPTGGPAAEVRVDAPARNVRIEVQPIAKISGRLQGEGNLEGFWVRAWSGDMASSRATAVVTGTDGTFSLDVPARTMHRVVATKLDDDRYAAVEGVVAEGGPLVLRLETGLSIEGTVEAADAQTSVTAASASFRTSARVVDGRFRLRGLPPGRYRLDARAGNRPLVATDVEAGTTGVRLRPTE